MKELKTIEDLYFYKFNLKDVYEINLAIPGMELFIYDLGYKIYKLTCNIEYTEESIPYYKTYIGSTNQSIYTRWINIWSNNAHFQILDRGDTSHKYSAIRKYGLENFTLELLPHSEGRNEKYWISEFDSFYKGYNNTIDGLSSFNSSCGVLTGKYHMTNGEINLVCKPNEVEDYTSKGFHRGLTFSDKGLEYRNSQMESKSGFFSPESQSKAGKIGGKIASEINRSNKSGWFNPEVQERGRNSQRQLKVGVIGAPSGSEERVRITESAQKVLRENKSCAFYNKEIHDKAAKLGAQKSSEAKYIKGFLVLKYLKDNNIEVSLKNYQTYKLILYPSHHSTASWNNLIQRVEFNSYK